MKQNFNQLNPQNHDDPYQEKKQSNSEDINKNSYGENFHDHLLEQYKLYVEMMDKVTERRGQTNTFYISLLSGLLALLSFLIDKDSNLFSGERNIFLLVFGILGIALCYVWHININSYKQLNSLKFKVINEIESYLPFRCYYREWEILREEKKHKYRRLNKVEKFVPLILSFPYFLLLIFAFLDLIGISSICPQ
ncbi:MAG: hypothetical protein AB4063_04265 [Crocosphaera sp.]